MKKIFSYVAEENKDEHRLMFTLANIEEFVKAGYTIYAEKGVGRGAGFEDSEYEKAGAKLTDTKTAWTVSDNIVKFKAPAKDKYKYFRDGLNICAALHVEGDRDLMEAVLRHKMTAYTWDFMTVKEGFCSIVSGYSEISGKAAVIYGAYYLQTQFGGKGKFLAHIRDAEPATVVIIGHGFVGASAAKLAQDLGCKVIILGKHYEKLRRISYAYGPNVEILENTDENLRKVLPKTDVLIGAILISTYDTPAMITAEHIALMEKGSVIVDVTCGYGEGVGYMPTIDKFTTLENPVYRKDGMVYIKINNLPSGYPLSALETHTKTSFSYIKEIIDDMCSVKKSAAAQTCCVIKNGKTNHPEIERHRKIYGL